METNIRIIESGKNLTLDVKKILLKGHSLSNQQINSICSRLGNKYLISAIPYREDNKQFILINSAEIIPVSDIKVTTDDPNIEWTIVFSDDIEVVTLRFSVPKHRRWIADLYRKKLLLMITRKRKYWRIGDSNRIFYEKKPFKSFKDIDAYRRFKVSDVVIDEAGLGFSIEVGTGFFTSRSVASYFSSEGGQKRFNKLVNRKGERKGTLLFRSPSRIMKVYFEKFDEHESCGTVPPFTVKETSYANLVDYYKGHSNYKINENDSVAYVSFYGMGTKPVPAKKLRVRVFNDMLPWKLKNIDKIKPPGRRKLAEDFWIRIGQNILGEGYDEFNSHKFYKPSRANQGIVELPVLLFGKNDSGDHQKLIPPSRINPKTYKSHYWDRKNYLDKYGCFFVPPVIDRELYIPFPKSIPDEIAKKLATDICRKASSLTKVEIEPVTFQYEHFLDAVYELKNDNPSGTVLFIFEDDDPATYFNISYELEGWGLKRITVKELEKKYTRDQEGKRGWDSFIDLNSYDLIQQMDCIPWVTESKLNYDMHLAIDVSEDYSHFAMSLMIFTEGMPHPVIKTSTKRKVDSYLETINEVFLKDSLIRLFQDRKCQNFIRKYSPTSLLVYRDGKDCNEEFSAISESIAQLKDNGFLAAGLHFDFIEYHKNISKGIRMWHNSDYKVVNVIEGSYFLRGRRSAIISTTGEGTLPQGTAGPIEVSLKYTDGNIHSVIEDVFITAQLNFSNPIIAQKLSLPLKRTDELLKEKRAQEIKRIK